MVSSASLWLTSVLTLSLGDVFFFFIFQGHQAPDKVRQHIKRGVHKSPARDVLLSAAPTGTEQSQTSSKSKKLEADHVEDWDPTGGDVVDLCQSFVKQHQSITSVQRREGSAPGCDSRVVKVQTALRSEGGLLWAAVWRLRCSPVTRCFPVTRLSSVWQETQ